MNRYYNHLLTLAILFTTIHSSMSQCQNSIMNPINFVEVGSYNLPVVISTVQTAGEYSQVINLENGMTYSFGSSTSTDYITLRSADNIAVLAQGTSPVSYTALESSFTIIMHINTSSSCDDDAFQRTTTVTCTNCNAPPGLIGVNTDMPKAVLDVNGEIRIGQTELIPVVGMMRYNDLTDSFEGYTDEGWTILNSNVTDPFESSDLIDAAQGRRINNWIGNKSQKWELCYKKTIDDDTSIAFHENCDFKGASVTIIKLDNNRIFGGYKSGSWTSLGSYRELNSAFLFSIDNDTKYELGRQYDKAIYDHNNYGPTFGSGHDFYVNSSMNLGYINFPYSYAYNGSDLSPTNVAAQELAGIDSFTAATIDELEVWIKVD